MDKTTNNNNDRYNLQMNLSGQIASTKGSVVLKGYYKYFLETFYMSQNIALTPTNLFDAWGSELGIHENTVKNFIKAAISRGWIYETKPIEGDTLSNGFMMVKQPDYLSTGQLVYDKRFKYYRITSGGKIVFELHEKIGRNNEF